MPFDPNIPQENTDLDAAEVRENFNALKALIDALTAMTTPIGGITAWCKNLPGVPALAANFVECNGQVLSDVESPLDGQTIPDLNTFGRFLYGNLNSGNTGGIDSFGTSIA